MLWTQLGGAWDNQLPTREAPQEYVGKLAEFSKGKSYQVHSMLENRVKSGIIFYPMGEKLLVGQ